MLPQCVWYLRITSVWGFIVWLPRKNVQHLSSLLLMLITAHQHLDTHKQNQSGTRSQPKTFSYYKKTNKQDCNMIKHTEHFPSNLQAGAHKNPIWFYSLGGRTLTNTSHLQGYSLWAVRCIQVYFLCFPSTSHLPLGTNMSNTLKYLHIVKSQQKGAFPFHALSEWTWAHWP